MIDKRLAEWLANGDTGASSEAIALWLGAKVKRRTWGAETPSDPSDLGRCLRLLEAFPEWKPRMSEMAEAGGNWPTFVEHWDEMAKSMADEVGIDWSKGKKAPRTYALIKKVDATAWAKRKADERPIDLGSGMTVRFS